MWKRISFDEYLRITKGCYHIHIGPGIYWYNTDNQMAARANNADECYKRIDPIESSEHRFISRRIDTV